MSGAGAQTNPGTWDNNGGGLDAGAGGSGAGYFAEVERYGPGRSGVGSSDDPCTYQRLDYRSYQLFWRGLPWAPESGEPLVQEGDPGAEELYAHDWIVMVCLNSAGIVDFIDGFQLGEPPEPGPMLEHARRALRIPLPDPRFNPGADAPQVVGLETWLWVDAASAAGQAATACIPAGAPAYACATVIATFVDVAWSMGDTTPELNCEGPGRPYDPTISYRDQADVDHCAHVYQRADAGGSTYDVVATTIWHLRWSCVYDAGVDGTLDPSCGGGDLGLVGRTGPPTPLQVLDLQARAT